jgi:hypothetical protein
MVGGGNAAATAGLSDVVGRSLVGPNGMRTARLAATMPKPEAGNVIGNAAGGAAAPDCSGCPAWLRVRWTLGAKAFGRFAPVAPMRLWRDLRRERKPGRSGRGAFIGSDHGRRSRHAGRRVAGGLANVIAPPAGKFGPAYAQGVFPTIGQRFGGSGFGGRVVNTAEQAMQSFPGLGALVSRARQDPARSVPARRFQRRTRRH